jgi:SAM-dependent methyltransferase
MINKLYQLFLRVNTFRSIVSICYAFLYLKILRRKVKTYKNTSEYVSKQTIASNLRILDSSIVLPNHPTATYFLGVGKNQGGAKSDMLINPINAILAAQMKNKKDLTVLSVGPRSYGELLNLRSHGFEKKKIFGVDLFSLFDEIIVGDMHSLPFADNSFDVLICGWVIAYSENRTIAASEITRVLKPNGIFSIGVSFTTESNETQILKRGYLVGASERILNTNQILSYFGTSIGNVYFRVEPVNELAHSQILLTASIKK